MRYGSGEQVTIAAPVLGGVVMGQPDLPEQIIHLFEVIYCSKTLDLQFDFALVRLKFVINAFREECYSKPKY